MSVTYIRENDFRTHDQQLLNASLAIGGLVQQVYEMQRQLDDKTPGGGDCFNHVPATLELVSKIIIDASDQASCWADWARHDNIDIAFRG